jgi:putative effector of murein hydrolase LrgA (UPF0299 family)
LNLFGALTIKQQPKKWIKCGNAILLSQLRDAMLIFVPFFIRFIAFRTRIFALLTHIFRTVFALFTCFGALTMKPRPKGLKKCENSKKANVTRYVPKKTIVNAGIRS